jgi:hypothetical protein
MTGEPLRPPIAEMMTIEPLLRSIMPGAAIWINQ